MKPVSISVPDKSSKICVTTSSVSITSIVTTGKPKPVGISVNNLSPKLYSWIFSFAERLQCISPILS